MNDERKASPEMKCNGAGYVWIPTTDRWGTPLRVRRRCIGTGCHPVAPPCDFEQQMTDGSVERCTLAAGHAPPHLVAPPVHAPAPTQDTTRATHVEIVADDSPEMRLLADAINDTRDGSAGRPYVAEPYGPTADASAQEPERCDGDGWIANKITRDMRPCTGTGCHPVKTKLVPVDPSIPSEYAQQYRLCQIEECESDEESGENRATVCGKCYEKVAPARVIPATVTIRPAQPLPVDPDDTPARGETPEASDPHVGANIRGRCPACGFSSLFRGTAGYVTCSFLDCPDPAAATKLLEREGV